MPDLIIIDMMMPVMSGYEAVAELKSQDDTKTIPIVGLSAKAMATASTGDAGAVLAAGKGLKAVVTQSTTGTSKAGKLEIVVEAITR